MEYHGVWGDDRRRPEEMVWDAACGKDLEKFKRILGVYPATDLNRRNHDESGRTLLMKSVLNNDLPLATFLVEEKKVDLDIQSSMGFTALMMAAQVENGLSFVGMLLKNGARVDLKTDRMETALHRAAWFGRNDAIRLLVNAGCNLDAQNDMGQTALHCATCENLTETVRVLNELFADSSIIDREERTPLQIVSQAHGGIDYTGIIAVLQSAPDAQHLHVGRAFKKGVSAGTPVGKKLTILKPPKAQFGIFG
jgi:ankyrin repeat protein